MTRSKLLAEIEALREENARLREERDTARAQFKRFADDALAGLSGLICTPEEGYAKAPFLLRGDLRRLRSEVRSVRGVQ